MASEEPGSRESRYYPVFEMLRVSGGGGQEAGTSTPKGARFQRLESFISAEEVRKIQGNLRAAGRK